MVDAKPVVCTISVVEGHHWEYNGYGMGATSRVVQWGAELLQRTSIGGVVRARTAVVVVLFQPGKLAPISVN